MYKITAYNMCALWETRSIILTIIIQSIVRLQSTDLCKSLHKSVEERNPSAKFFKNSDKDFDTIKSELKALILGFAKGPEKKFYITQLDNSISASSWCHQRMQKPYKSMKFNRVTDLDEFAVD